MWLVGRATSAGPTFFPPQQYTADNGRNLLCVDGGLVANDPAFIAYTDAQVLSRQGGVQSTEVILLSLGTGKPVAKSEEEDLTPQLVAGQSWLQMAPSLLGAMSSGAAELQRAQLAQMLGSGYVRIQTQLGFGASHAMDNVRTENISALRACAENLADKARPHLQNLLPALSG
jgi:patatin-like phospholipase/acyl hydrolase